MLLHGCHEGDKNKKKMGTENEIFIKNDFVIFNVQS